ncbi:ADP-ribose pyrophosphatase [Nitrosomonas cryotolerans]|uniref:ADP-ribose pyrophosphatase n=1 Tax=Nitrosomonas cryotolerans ATCC 49181 TaxID=1131553 RepID=A0A1N6HHZ5_9PROT|nr:ADP-ribose diphosphatase [Nitrosomonas cryotolerans]SFP65587.1 ADP-ribose pyrophosphatase [Nitrosomonas cryotolerans]SIO19275.1 ADP-ribose pyrophosphatase [Nitrosomonas cryotolerans ATCC 49181]
MIKRNVEVLEKTICYEGFFRLERYCLRYRLFNGDWSQAVVRELFERGHAAAVLPYDPFRDEVILIEQFRIGAMTEPNGPWLMEIVAGIVEAGETGIDVVKRESIEEAACTIVTLIPVYDYLVSPGGTTERVALFCGKVDTTQAGGVYGVAEENEDIRVHVMTVDAALALLNAGKIRSASAIIALQWLALNRNHVRMLWST